MTRRVTIRSGECRPRSYAALSLHIVVVLNVERIHAEPGPAIPIVPDATAAATVSDSADILSSEGLTHQIRVK